MFEEVCIYGSSQHDWTLRHILLVGVIKDSRRFWKTMIIIPLASLTFFMQLTVLASPLTYIHISISWSNKIDALEITGAILLAHNRNPEKFPLGLQCWLSWTICVLWVMTMIISRHPEMIIEENRLSLLQLVLYIVIVMIEWSIDWICCTLSAIY